TGRADPPDVSFPKDTGREDVGGNVDTGDIDPDVDDSPDVLDGGRDPADVGADGGLDADETDVSVEPDVAPGVDVDPEPCGGSCGSGQVCENNACVDVCQRTGSQC